MKKTKTKTSIRTQAGATLIEILIAVVVMAAGLLGLAGLQMNSLQYQKTSSSRSEAAQAVYDIGERIRSNWVMTPAGAAADRAANEGRYNFVRTYAAAKAETPAVNLACSTSVCNTQQIANNDFAEWLRNIQQRLPGGAASITPVTVNPAPFSAFDVVVMWVEQGFTGTDANCPGAVGAPVGVKCLVVRVSI